MSNPKTQQHIIGLLQEHHATARQMLAILQQEMTALASNDLAAYDRILEQKQQQANRLESFEQGLSVLEGAIGSPATLANFIQFVQHPANSPLRPHWQKLQDTLRECQQQNLLNSRIAEASRINTQQALDILRGGTGSANPGVYESSGKTRFNTSGNSLAVA
jgi:flagellar biosynthesis/type III secretory pathway chaperone